jgi:hypothetical protein
MRAVCKKVLRVRKQEERTNRRQESQDLRLELRSRRNEAFRLFVRYSEASHRQRLKGLRHPRCTRTPSFHPQYGSSSPAIPSMPGSFSLYLDQLHVTPDCAGLHGEGQSEEKREERREKAMRTMRCGLERV